MLCLYMNAGHLRYSAFTGHDESKKLSTGTYEKVEYLPKRAGAGLEIFEFKEK